MNPQEALQYARVWACELSKLDGYARATNDFVGYARLLQTLWSAFLGSLKQQGHNYHTMPLEKMVEHFHAFLCDLSHNHRLKPEAFVGDDELQQLIRAGNKREGTILCDRECPVPEGVARQTLEAFVNFCADRAQVSPDGLHEVPPPFVFAMALIPTSYVFNTNFRKVIADLHQQRLDPDTWNPLIYLLGTYVGTQLLWPGEAGDSNMLCEACKKGDLNRIRIGDILRDILQVGAQEEGGGRGRRRRIAQRDVVKKIIRTMNLGEGWKKRVQAWSQRKEQRDQGSEVIHLEEEEAPISWENIPGGSDVEDVAAAERVASALLAKLDRCVKGLMKECPALDQLVQYLFGDHPCPEEGEQPQEQRGVPTGLQNPSAPLKDQRVLQRVLGKLKEVDRLIREQCRCEDPPWPEPPELEGRYLMDLLREVECLLRRYEKATKGRVDQRLGEAVQAAQGRLGDRPRRDAIAREIRRDPCLWIRIVRKLV